MDTIVDYNIVRDCLTELSSKKFQLEVWTARTPGIMAIPEEAVERLLGSSGLMAAIERNYPTVFDKQVFIEFTKLLVEVLNYQDIDEMIRSAEMKKVRAQAGLLLQQLSR